MSSRVLTVVVTGETAGLERAMGKVSASTETAGKKMSKVGAIAGKVALGGITLLAGGMYESAKAAVEAQGNTDRLDQAIKRSGLNFTRASNQLNGFAAAQTKFGVSANDAKGYLAGFVIATGNAHMATRDLSLAENIAAAKNISLSAAVQMVTKAQAGSTRMMTASGLIYQKTTEHADALTAKYKALGLTTKNMTPEQVKQYNAAKRQASILDKQANATNLLRIGFNKYGGQAAAASQTLEGKWKTLHAQADNLEVTVGQKLLPAITKVTNWMMSHTGDVKILGGAIIGLTAAMGALWVATKIYLGYQKAVIVMTRIWTAAQIALDLVLAGNPIALAVIAAIALAAAFVVLWKRSGTFRDVVKGALHDIQVAFHAVSGFIREHWQTMLTIITGGASNAVQFIINHWDKIKAAFNAVVGFVREHWRGMLTILTGGVSNAVIFIANHWDTIKSAFNHVVTFIINRWGNVKSVLSTIGGAINTYIVDPIKTAVGWVQDLIRWVGKIHFPSIPSFHIPGTATGGVVTSPQVRLVGEAGPEAIIPLSRMGSFGGGGGNIIVHIDSVIAGTEPQVTAFVRRAVVQALRQQGANAFKTSSGLRP